MNFIVDDDECGLVVVSVTPQASVMDVAMTCHPNSMCCHTESHMGS
jgi:hypothetical protein